MVSVLEVTCTSGICEIVVGDVRHFLTVQLKVCPHLVSLTYLTSLARWRAWLPDSIAFRGRALLAVFRLVVADHAARVGHHVLPQGSEPSIAEALLNDDKCEQDLYDIPRSLRVRHPKTSQSVVGELFIHLWYSDCSRCALQSLKGSIIRTPIWPSSSTNMASPNKR